MTGDFQQILLPDLAGGLAWDDAGLLVHGSLSVVPEPTTLVLLIGGLLSLLAIRPPFFATRHTWKGIGC